MNRWFTPTAANYFNHVNRGTIETVMREAVGDQGYLAVRAATKKKEAALIAERLVEKTGWLPQLVRIDDLEQPEALADMDEDAEDVEESGEDGDEPEEEPLAAEGEGGVSRPNFLVVNY